MIRCQLNFFPIIGWNRRVQSINYHNYHLKVTNHVACIHFLNQNILPSDWLGLTPSIAADLLTVLCFGKLEKWTGQSLANINLVKILTPIYKLVKSWMLKVWQICLTWRFYVDHVNTKLRTMGATLSNQNKIESTIRNKSQTFNFWCKVSINTI